MDKIAFHSKVVSGTDWRKVTRSLIRKNDGEATIGFNRSDV